LACISDCVYDNDDNNLSQIKFNEKHSVTFFTLIERRLFRIARRFFMAAQPVSDRDFPADRTVDYSAVALSQVIMPLHAGPGGIYAHGGEIKALLL
jgi:hypothetical protein